MTPVDPEARLLLERWAATPGGPVDQLTPAAVRREDLALREPQAAPARLHAVDDAEVPGSGGALTARVYRYDAPLRQLALSTGCLIVALHCRASARAPLPRGDRGGGLARHARRHGRRPGRSARVVGDSSGGNLAAVVACTLTRTGAPLAFQVLLYPMLGATASSPSLSEFASGYGFSREGSLWCFDQ
jgi:acetyl esterase